MSVQDITGDTPVAHLVSYIELSSIQYAFGWNPRVSTRTASQLWKMEREDRLVKTNYVLLQYVEYNSVHFIFNH